MKNLILSLLLFPSFVFAQNLNQNFSFENFEKAKTSPHYLKFIVESTKVGLFSSDVDGYVKNFTATCSKKGEEVENLVVEFEPRNMDTDDNSRDEKLHNKCMSIDQFPKMKVTIKGPLAINGKKQVVDAIFNIRGKDKTSPLSLVLTKEDGKIKANGKTVISLKEMEIPDPSIAVAKLSDDIRIEFELFVPEK